MSNKITDITAIILAGGKSSRMNTNKAFLEINGKTFFSKILDLLNESFETVLINTNDPIPFQEYGCKIIKDIIPSYGPLSGIHSGLFNSRTEKIFCVSCDMPLLNQQVLNYLINQNGAAIVLPVINSIPQYDCGIYSRSLINEIEKMIEIPCEKISLKNLVKRVGAKFISEDEIPNCPKNSFININTPQNYELLKTIVMTDQCKS